MLLKPPLLTALVSVSHCSTCVIIQMTNLGHSGHRKFNINQNIISLAAALLAGGAFAAKFSSGDETSELFKSNVEALANEEIVVGELCGWSPFTFCISLGEIIFDYTKA